MAIGVTKLTANGSTAAATTYATASVTPAAGGALVAAFETRGIASNIPNTITSASLGGAWVVIGSVYDTVTLSAFTVWRNLTYSSVASTITFGNTDSGLGGVWSVWVITGADPTTPFRNVVSTHDVSGNSLALTLGAPATANSRAFSLWYNWNSVAAQAAPATSYTELDDVAGAHTTDPSTLETQWSASAFVTAAGVTWTGGPYNGGGIAFEAQVPIVAADPANGFMLVPPGLYGPLDSRPVQWAGDDRHDLGGLLGQPAETDLAQPVTVVQGPAWTITMGQPAETDTAQPVTVVQSAITVTLGQPVEQDDAQPMTRDVDPSAVLWLQAPGLFTGPGSGPVAWDGYVVPVVAADWVITAGQVTETDLAQPVTAIVTPWLVVTGQPVETDLAQPIASVVTPWLVPVGQAAEQDLAQPMTRDVDPSTVLWFVAPGLFTGPGSGPVPWSGDDRHDIQLTASQATETDLAQAITPVVSPWVVTVNQAAETDLSQPVTPSRVVTVGQAVSTEVAQPVGGYIDYPADMIFTAPGLFGAPGSVAAPFLGNPALPTADHLVTVGQSTEQDDAQPVTVIHPWTVIVGQTAEIDTAQSATPINTHVVTVGQLVEVDLAQLVAAIKTPLTVAAGQVTETDLAQPIHASHPVTVLLGQALSVELAQPVTRPTGTTVATLSSTPGGVQLATADSPQGHNTSQSTGGVTSSTSSPSMTSAPGGSSLRTTDGTQGHNGSQSADTLSSHDDTAGGPHV